MTRETRRKAARRRCLAILLLAASLTAAAQQDVPVYAGRGLVPVHVPPGYADGDPAPLVIALHGHGSNGPTLEFYIQFTPLSDQRGFLLAMPNGLRDSEGVRYWNGTDACCGEDTDDSGYLRDLIAVIATRFTVNSRRVFVFGHSNGGFMAHRIGCDQADLVAAIVSLSAATWEDAAQCVPVAPVHALEIHGTSDTIRNYGGGCTEPDVCYPSAPETALTWAQLNHCTASDSSPVRLDLTETIPGRDTMTQTFSACDAGGSSALWTIVNGPHHPALSPSFNDIVIDYLLSHPKPGDIPCDEVVSVHAQCGPTGSLAIDVQLTDASHDGRTVNLEIDGASFVAPVRGSHALLALTTRAPGMHVARLVEPAACAADVEVTC